MSKIWDRIDRLLPGYGTDAPGDDPASTRVHYLYSKRTMLLWVLISYVVGLLAVLALEFFYPSTGSRPWWLLAADLLLYNLIILAAGYLAYRGTLNNLQARYLSEGRLLSIAEISSDAVFAFGANDMRITIWSKGAERVFGFSTEEAVGMGLDLITPDDFLQRDMSLIEGLAQEGFYSNHRTLSKRKGGEVFPSAVSATLLDTPGEEQGEMVIVVRDVTEQVRVEDELKRSRDELEERVAERTAELDYLNRELETFSSSVSHDLKAPVRAVKGLCEMLVEKHSGSLNPEGRRVLGMIKAHADLMCNLIDALLEFSRLGRGEMRKMTVDMTGAARDACGDYELWTRGRRINLTIGELPPAVGDPMMLRQVFANLIGNAVKFTRGTDLATIEVGGRERDGENVYYVKDNGVGFDMKHAEKMFGVFKRLHSSEQFEGTGIGLALVKKIVNRHGGRVWAESALGEGATIFFTIPAP